MKEKDFFYENDVMVTKKAIKVMRWLVFVFPCIMIFSLLGLFQTEMKNLAVMTVIGIIVTMTPTIAYKAGMPIGILKYVATLALGGLLIIMASDASIGIYMTYGLPMVFSIFYYDKKFTKKIAVISYFLLVLSLYFRSLGVKQIEFDTNFIWFVSRSVGFLIETVVMALICVKIAESARKLLESLNNSQKVAALVEECNQASGELLEVVSGLEQNITEFRKTNAVISKSAEHTLTDCDSNQKFADYLHNETNVMEENIEQIHGESSGMFSIAEETFEKMENYIAFMEQTGDGMKKVQETAHETENSIQNLKDAVTEVSGFAATIEKITAQTNLLALNASIEAARAGDMGKGFSVVAGEVKVLAENSKQASNAIEEIIRNIENILAQVQEKNRQNLLFVNEGIEQIGGARKEAGQIGTLQMDSKEMAKKVSDASEGTKQSGQKLQSMSEEMRGLVANLRQKAEKIVEESRSQAFVTEDVEKAFKQVEQVAQRLVQISRG